jgi:hypothetical protein
VGKSAPRLSGWKQIILKAIMKSHGLKVVPISMYSLTILWKHLVENSITFSEV